MVDLDDYVPMIDAILSASDPDQVTPKRIRKALQELFGINLDSHRKDINQIIIERFQESQSRPRQLITKEELLKKDEAIARQLQKEDHTNVKRSRGSPKTPSKAKKRKTKENATPNPNGLNARKVMLAEPLSKFLGETMLPRTQVVKLMWDYIKEHQLQNPEDRREILCDEKMRPIFGQKMTMFSMNKILSNFLYNPDDVVKESSSPQEETESSN